MWTSPTAGDARPDPPPPFADAPAALGAVLLGHWSVAEIHRGGQAWVLVVDDVEHGDRRAIKLPLSGALTGDAELAMLLALDPHPHVVTALDVAEIGGRRGLMLEYVPATLADLLRGRRAEDAGRSPWLLPRAAVMQEICAGMAHLSEIDELVHLDLKPSNVLLDAAGRAKVADFGLSQRVDVREARYPSPAGGTWAYAAPEVIRGERCDSRADVFSFGVLLHQARTGRLPYPFPLASAPDAQRAQLLDFYESPERQSRAWRPDQGDGRAPLPEEIARLIGYCLEYYMDERPQSFTDLAGEIANDLEIPPVLAEAVALPEGDRLRRELALCQALTRAGRFEEAVRRMNRLLSSALPPELSAPVLRAAREALVGAGRAGDAAALDEWG